MSQIEKPSGNVCMETDRVTLAYVVIKLLGMTYIVRSVEILGFVVMGLGSGLDYYRRVVPSLILLFLGGLLIAYAAALARLLMGEDRKIVLIESTGNCVALISIGLGLYFLAISFETLPRALIRFTELRGSVRASSEDLGGMAPYQEFLVPGMRLCIGLFLFLRPGWIVGQWRRRVVMPTSEPGFTP